jgi:hypothetical protein
MILIDWYAKLFKKFINVEVNRILGKNLECYCCFSWTLDVLFFCKYLQFHNIIWLNILLFLSIWGFIISKIKKMSRQFQISSTSLLIKKHSINLFNVYFICKYTSGSRKCSKSILTAGGSEEKT